MTTGSILLAIALLIIVGVYVLRPILLRHDSETAEKSIMLTQKEAALQQIRLLDLDHETGKIPDDAYTIERERLMIEAAALLQRIDMVGDEDVDQQIERAVAVIRAAAFE